MWLFLKNPNVKRDLLKITLTKKQISTNIHFGKSANLVEVTFYRMKTRSSPLPSYHVDNQMLGQSKNLLYH